VILSAEDNSSAVSELQLSDLIRLTTESICCTVAFRNWTKLIQMNAVKSLIPAT